MADQLEAWGYLVIRYSKSQGGRIHNYSGLKPNEKQAIDSRLNALGLLSFLTREGQNTPEETRNFFRGAARLLQLAAAKTKPVAVIIDYTENLAPAVATSAAAADEQTFVAETLHHLANAPALRKSGNLLLCLVREGLQNILLNDLHRVQLPFPDESQTRAFIDWALQQQEKTVDALPRYAPLEPSFEAAEFARLTRGLRLRDVEAMLREAKAAGTPLSRHRVLEAKAEAISRTSEGTLSVISSPLTLDDLVGLDVVKRCFRLIASKLKAGDASSPRAILMVGPPGTAKSTGAGILASLCGFNLLKFQTVKNMYVGESERRLNLALSLVETQQPATLFLDEITETTPSRNQGINDGGVSQDLLGQLFQFSARDDLRGKVLLLAASNVPERLDPAWHDRFVTIPFLELLPNEICQLFPLFERRVRGTSSLDPREPILIEASDLLHRKGASPRRVLDIVNHALLTSPSGPLQPAAILSAAQDYVGAANPMAVAYSSLVAVSLTSFRSYLPWSLDPKGYIYPWYLDGIVEQETGELDRKELRTRIQAYRKETNL
jgi:SpoVK/Ycf46/Vps4 family AAA+-type ATPase